MSMTTLVPKFVDHHPAYTSSGYTVTNEEPHLFNALLGKTKVQRAACIASGGEVLLSVILHRANEIVAVDHSYASLSATYEKILLLRKLPTKTALELLREEKYNDLIQQVQRNSKHLPTFQNYARNPIGVYTWQSVRREWCRGDFRTRSVSKADIEKMTLVHGDLRDLGELYGAFDLLYASNAMEHSGRDHKSPKLADLAKLLNPGGWLLYTKGGKENTAVVSDAGFTDVKQIKGLTSSWWYVIARKRT